ncbi:indole-3-glycerol phosphate synthase [Pseudomonas sp. St290]|nr:indole-3-glycerol phosphate synthase [Pseudomonas sp. St290]
MVWVAPDILLLLEGNDIEDRAYKGVRATRSLGAVSRATIGDGFVESNFELLTLVKRSEAGLKYSFD